jgi:hypothetical protein
MMPKYHQSLSSINYSNDNLVQPQYHNSITTNTSSTNGNNDNVVDIANDAVVVAVATRPSRQSSTSSSSTYSKQKRPLTRYLPNFSLDFNLKSHIETAGHQLQLCPHVTIDGMYFFLSFSLFLKKMSIYIIIISFN